MTMTCEKVSGTEYWEIGYIREDYLDFRLRQWLGGIKMRDIVSPKIQLKKFRIKIIYYKSNGVNHRLEILGH